MIKRFKKSNLPGWANTSSTDNVTTFLALTAVKKECLVRIQSIISLKKIIDLGLGYSSSLSRGHVTIL